MGFKVTAGGLYWCRVLETSIDHNLPRVSIVVLFFG